jgi:hypothetical protein
VMSESELAEIRKRAEAATPGPWRWVQKDDYYVLTPSTNDDQPYPQIHSDGSACGEYGPDIDVRGPDGVFIEHSRADVPALLAEVDRLRAENEELKFQLTDETR